MPALVCLVLSSEILKYRVSRRVLKQACTCRYTPLSLTLSALFLFQPMCCACCAGRVYDATAVGRVAKAHNIPYLLDACQSVGQLPVDVKAIGCDWATGTSRKFLRGPRGIGWLYASR